jgi:uncharacterized SAM-binding protein YcdF (DUF218 family)
MQTLLLTKILTPLILPLGQVFVLATLALAAAVLGRRTAAMVLGALAFALLALYASPSFAGFLAGTLERQYPIATAAQSPQAELAVVLGGMSGRLKSGGDPQVNEAADRALHAARLYRLGKLQRILVSGGNLPWDRLQVPEAEVIAGLLEELGVPPGAITIEAASATTYENAVEAAKLPQVRDNSGSLLLITSGWHMPRAVAAFEAQGVRVIPSPTDQRLNPDAGFGVFALLPDAGALALSTLAVKEWAGIAWYSLSGKLRRASADRG